MIKALLSVLILCFVTLSISAQTGGLRPRVAATPIPPKIQNDPPPATADRPPPVLSERGGQTQPSSAAAKQGAKPADDEVITVETNLITTPVSVLDRNGRFIPGLRKKDFKIFEDGVPQTITYFQSEEQPFTVVLMIDTSPSTAYHIDQIHYAALTFVNQLRPVDKVMVIAFDQRMRLLAEATSDRQLLYSAIYKAQFGSGTSLYDAVDAVIDSDIVKTPGRKAVVIFTDGVDTTSRRANYASTLLGVEEVDALVYPIRYNTQRKGDAGGMFAGLPPGIQLPPGFQLPPGITVRMRRGQSDEEYLIGKTYLETLALNSGGRIFEADTITNLAEAFAGVAEELRRQYSIGYYASEDGRPGDRKRIKIQVARPKAVVRAKTSYVVREKKEASEPAQPGYQSF